VGDEEGEKAEEAEEGQVPAPRRRLPWRILGLLVLVAFATWTSATIVDILAEGTPSRDAVRAGPPRSGPDRVTLAAAGDIGSGEAGTATLDEMAKARGDVYLALGDLSSAGPGSEAEWCELVRSKVGPVAPFEIVAGNHEEDTGEDGRIGGFTACLPDRLNAVGEYGRQYYFDLGKLARVVMISPNLTLDGAHYFYGEGNANIQWLADAIDSARAAGIRWVVVGMHKNCISVGEHSCDTDQELLSVLAEKRVDLVLQGHDGCASVAMDSFDTDCVVSDSRDGDYRRGARTIFISGGRHGLAFVAITDSTLSVEFVGSTPGSFGDEFEIVGSGEDQRP
jgi:hypothetical protein